MYQANISGKFIQLMTEEEWNFVYENQPLEQTWDRLYKKVEKMLNDYCPLKKFKFRRDKPEWMTNELIEFIKDRDAALKKATKSKKKEDKQIARNIQNFTNNMVRNARANYIKEQLEHNKSDPKKFWHSIREVIPNNNESSGSILELHNERGEPIPGQDLAHYINNYFANVGMTLAEKFDKVLSEVDIPHHEFVPLTLAPVTLEQLNKEIDKIAVYKSSGFRNISSEIWKIVFKALDVFILHMINTSIITNQFPDSWKVATIIPIPKVTNPKKAGELRPIALLPIIGKLVERFVHAQIIEYLNRYDLLSPYQNGFRPEHSTVDTVYKFISDIDMNTNSGRDTIAVYVDFKKAFDTVNHLVLIKKAAALNLDMSVLNWLSVYLGNRNQSTLINNLRSDKQMVPCGVPQGSIMGPLLFLIYINDINRDIYNSRLLLYADDLVLYRPVDRANALGMGDVLTFQNDLDNIKNGVLKIG